LIVTDAQGSFLNANGNDGILVPHYSILHGPTSVKIIKLLYMLVLCGTGDGVGNTIKENSSVFSKV